MPPSFSIRNISLRQDRTVDLTRSQHAFSPSSKQPDGRWTETWATWKTEAQSHQAVHSRLCRKWRNCCQRLNEFTLCEYVCLCSCVNRCSCTCVRVPACWRPEASPRDPLVSTTPALWLQACVALPGLFCGWWESELRSSLLQVLYQQPSPQPSKPWSHPQAWFPPVFTHCGKVRVQQPQARAGVNTPWLTILGTVRLGLVKSWFFIAERKPCWG